MNLFGKKKERMETKIHILYVGYSHEDENDSTLMRANSTCTLICTKSGRNIIVDTMTAWDGGKILKGLKKHKISPKDINVVVCTHGHSDHIGCNYLFQNADWHIVGTCISHKDKYLDWNARRNCKNFKIDGDEVTVEKTPGHTKHCVSVFVRGSKLGEVVGICGDLFEREDDIKNQNIWLNAISEDPNVQRKERFRVAQICDFIIPGHGPGFYITQEIREELRKQSQEMDGKNRGNINIFEETKYNS